MKKSFVFISVIILFLIIFVNGCDDYEKTEDNSGILNKGSMGNIIFVDPSSDDGKNLVFSQEIDKEQYYDLNNQNTIRILSEEKKTLDNKPFYEIKLMFGSSKSLVLEGNLDVFVYSACLNNTYFQTSDSRIASPSQIRSLYAIEKIYSWENIGITKQDYGKTGVGGHFSADSIQLKLPLPQNFTAPAIKGYLVLYFKSIDGKEYISQGSYMHEITTITDEIRGAQIENRFIDLDNLFQISKKEWEPYSLWKSDTSSEYKGIYTTEGKLITTDSCEFTFSHYGKACICEYNLSNCCCADKDTKEGRMMVIINEKGMVRPNDIYCEKDVKELFDSDCAINIGGYCSTDCIPCKRLIVNY